MPLNDPHKPNVEPLSYGDFGSIFSESLGQLVAQFGQLTIALNQSTMNFVFASVMKGRMLSFKNFNAKNFFCLLSSNSFKKI